MKKILIVAEYFYPNVGGVENSIANLIREYSANGYQIDLVVSDKNLFTSEKLDEMDTFESIANVYRYHIPTMFRKISFMNVIFSWKIFKDLSVNNYENIITRTHVNFVFLHYFFCHKNKIKYIIPGLVFEQDTSTNLSKESFLLMTFRRFNSYISSTLQKYAINKSVPIVFSLDMYKSTKLLLNDKRVEPIITKPGVNSSFCYASPGEVNSLKKSHGLDVSTKYLLSVGRFVSAKGFEYALKSLEYLPENYSLILVGDGLEKNKYIEYASSKKLSSRVIILSNFKNVPDVYKMADIYLFTSVFEPLGQVILEAGASGLPLVAFEPSSLVKTAILEIEISNNIHLVKGLDAEELAKVVLSINDEKSESISELYSDKYSWLSLINVLK